MMIRLIYFLLILGVLFSCESRDAEQPAHTGSPRFFAVRIWGEDDNDNITCLLQVMNQGPGGKASRLEPGSKMELNGRQLEADSAKYSGVFYELTFPKDDLKDSQVLKLTTPTGESFQKSFLFRPIYLLAEEGQEIPARGTSLALSNFPKEEGRVNLLMTDTAYATSDLNILTRVKGGNLVLTDTMLGRLRRGPVVLQVYYEEETELDFGPHKGKLLTSYGLSREFLLK